MRCSVSFCLAAVLAAWPTLAAPAPDAAHAAVAAAATSPAAGAVVVDITGKHGSYKTIQSGIDALSTTATGTQNLFIYPGVYKEQVYIAPRKANLIIQGYTADSSSYHGNTVNITHSLALSGTTSDDLTATLRNWAGNSRTYNVNVLNTFGRAASNGQALALSASAGAQGYYGVALYGYQDTLLAETGAQLYAASAVVGAVDFIFGQTAQAWLENVDIWTVGPGAITASGRSGADSSWYVINNSNVKAQGGSGVAKGANYLGRPWGDYARVTVQNTFLSDVVAAPGWEQWNTGDARTGHVQFEEYKNSGPGSYPTEGPRASFSSQLSSARKIADILGSGYASAFYVDTKYL